MLVRQEDDRIMATEALALVVSGFPDAVAQALVAVSFAAGIGEALVDRLT